MGPRSSLLVIQISAETTFVDAKQGFLFVEYRRIVSRQHIPRCLYWPPNSSNQNYLTPGAGGVGGIEDMTSQATILESVFTEKSRNATEKH